IPRTVIQKNEVQHFSKAEKAERLLLYRMLHDKNIWLRINGIPDFNFIHENYQVIYNLSEAYFDTHDEYEVDLIVFMNKIEIWYTINSQPNIFIMKTIKSSII